MDIAALSAGANVANEEAKYNSEWVLLLDQLWVQ